MKLTIDNLLFFVEKIIITIKYLGANIFKFILYIGGKVIFLYKIKNLFSILISNHQFFIINSFKH